MSVNKIYGGHALRIVLGITILTFLLLAGDAGAITNNGVEKLIDIEGDYDPSYNPDGSKIVFSVGDPILNSGSVWILNLTSKEVSRINTPGGRDYLYTEWSPLGDTIAYNSYYNGVADICTINIDGSNENCLTTDQNFDVGGPEFSPDGSKIVYFSHIHEPYDIGDIWIMDANGENSVQLTNDRDYQSGPSWSPDGTKIVYSSGAWPNAHIWVMEVANPNNKVQLTFGPGFEGNPSWSPDGMFIAYQKQDIALQGPWNIWVMNADGTKQTQLTNNGIDGAQPDWNSDGKKIAFVSHGFNNNINWDIYEMTLGGIDNTPPTIDCGSADGLWHGTDVSIACTATDSDSGLANPDDASFSLFTNVAAGEETSSASTDTRYVCDNAGNCATAGPISGNMVDKKEPSISIIAPITGSYTLNQAVAANYSCTDSGSGVATCDGPVSSGSNFDTSTVGSKSFTVNAQDNVGNTASATQSYDIIYNWNGFFSPIDNLDSNNNLILNSVKAGSGVPVKFSLNGDQGLGIIATGFPKSSPISCDSNAIVDPVNETVAAGSSGLSYDVIADQYIYVWKTEKAWSNTCRQLNVKLVDGTTHVANFKFT